jgi:amidase
VRVPAHYCGVFGHKPTWGLCPTRGHALTVVEAMTDISVIGPLARSARDLSLVMDAIAGPDEAETALRIPLPQPRAMRLADLRVAVWSSERGQETDREITEAVDGVANFLERQGAKVSRTARPKFDPAEAYRLYLELLATALSARTSEDMLDRIRSAKARLADDDMSVHAIQVRAVDMTHRDWLRLNERRFHLRRVWSAFFHEWDVLLCPPIATAALPHMHDGETWERRMTVNSREIDYNDMLFWPGVTCAYHLPASVAPIGMTRAGLPIGVQIVGPLYGDRTTIHVAGLLEQQWRQFVAPPGWE